MPMKQYHEVRLLHCYHLRFWFCCQIKFVQWQRIWGRTSGGVWTWLGSLHLLLIVRSPLEQHFFPKRSSKQCNPTFESGRQTVVCTLLLFDWSLNTSSPYFSLYAANSSLYLSNSSVPILSQYAQVSASTVLHFLAIVLAVRRDAGVNQKKGGKLQNGWALQWGQNATAKIIISSRNQNRQPMV